MGQRDESQAGWVAARFVRMPCSPTSTWQIHHHCMVLSQKIIYIPTVSTHHGIEVGVGLATGRDHSVMTGLDEALSLIL